MYKELKFNRDGLTYYTQEPEHKEGCTWGTCSLISYEEKQAVLSCPECGVTVTVITEMEEPQGGMEE